MLVKLLSVKVFRSYLRLNEEKTYKCIFAESIKKEM